MFFDNGNQLIHTEVIIMAIEPLGSIMTVQAQPVQKVENIQPVTGTEASAQAENAPETSDDAEIYVNTAALKKDSHISYNDNNICML